MSKNKKEFTFYRKPAKMGDRYIFTIPSELKELMNHDKVYLIEVKEMDDK